MRFFSIGPSIKSGESILQHGPKKTVLEWHLSVFHFLQGLYFRKDLIVMDFGLKF